MNIEIIGYRDWAKKCHELVATTLDEAQFRVSWASRFEAATADLTVLVGWSDIVPEEVIGKMRSSKVLLVAHPSVLPNYRGGSPIQHQIMEGLESSAVSLFRLDLDHQQAVDSGPLCWQSGYGLTGDLPSILREIGRVTAEGIVTVARALNEERLTFWEQPAPTDGGRTRRRPNESELHRIEIAESTGREIFDKIRALGGPYPRAYLKGSDGVRVYIEEARLAPERPDDRYYVGTP